MEYIQINLIIHPDSAATAITMLEETIEFENVVEEELTFYEEYADKRFILVGADYETGELCLGDDGDYYLNLTTSDDYNESSKKMLQGYYKQNISHA